MDILSAWKDLDDTVFNQPDFEKGKIKSALEKESTSVMAFIGKRLNMYRWTSLIFGLVFLGLFLYQNELALQCVFGFMLAIYVLYTVSLHWLIQRLKKVEQSQDLDILSNLKAKYALIARVVNASKWMNYFIYPTSFLAGIIAGMMAQGAEFSEIINTPKYLIAIIISFVVVLPFLSLGTNKLTHHLFLKHFYKLRDQIEKMESLND